MNVLLRRIVERLIRTGNLRITGPTGITFAFGDGGGAPVHLHIKTRHAERAITLDPALGLPEAFMDQEADFLEGDRTDARNGVVVSQRVVTTREYTSGQSHDVFIEATHIRDLSPRWRLRVSGQASPASVRRLAIQLPDKYPGRTLVFRTTNLTASGHVELARGNGRWPLVFRLSGLRTINYSTRQTVDRNNVSVGAGIGRTW